MNATIVITDGDRFVDYTLAVAFDFLPGAEPFLGWLTGGLPGEAPAVEINSLRCIEIALWCGKYAVSALPASDSRQSLELQIGAWCLEKYADDIEQAVREIALARRDARRDSSED